MRRAAATVLVLVIAGVGCGGGNGRSAGTSTPPPRVVASPASAFASIAVESGGRRVTVPAAARKSLAPLLAARAFPPKEALAEYGLEQPVATLVYRTQGGDVIQVAIGGLTVDGHFRYVRRMGQSTIATVPASTLAPVLALVGA